MYSSSKVGLIESQVNSPLTSQELLLYISESPGVEGGLGACVQILPKHRHHYQLGHAHKLFPLVFLYLLNPEINCPQNKFPSPSGISSMNKICLICPCELSVQQVSDSCAVYNLVRHNMQKLLLQNQINAIYYKVSCDSPPDDKPVEHRIYSSCKLVALIF